MDETERADSHDSSDEESDDSSSDVEPVESLIAGRDRRSTAANRYDRQRIIEDYAEEIADDDEVNLLFAEDGEEVDEEFEDSEDGDDAENLDSSSDDDDQGPNAAADDLEGEQAIEQAEKEARTRKRKAKEAMTTGAGLRKKVKIDPAVSVPLPSTQPAKPSKKKERVSWILQGDKNARTSLRKHTIAHRAITHAKLQQDEQQRALLKARKEKRQRERGHEKPTAMTQADRLAEAARTERRNAKSLNRWEELEKDRAEKQAAKELALKTRTLEGPVITSWSGMAKWVGPRLSQVGGKDTSTPMVHTVEAKKRGRKPKGYYESIAAAKDAEMDQSSTSTPRDQAMTPARSDSVATPVEERPEAVMPPDIGPPQITFAAPQGPENFFLHGIHEYAVRPSSGPPSLRVQPPPPPPPPPPIPLPLPPPPPLLAIEQSTRNLVILQKFEQLTPRERGEFNLFYNNRKSAKPPKHSQELCPITSLPARYKSPSTGVAYANSYAYKKLEEVKTHAFRWSSMLGCYAGREGVAARGVPEGFLERRDG